MFWKLSRGKKGAERKRRETREEEEEEKREWEREKQMREQLVETERVKKQGQAPPEKGGDNEGKRGVETSDIGRQDWDQQAVQRQMALAEQRERGIGSMKGG